MEEQIYSITEIAAKIQNCVQTNFAMVHIKGEISGYKAHTSGHRYFALKDADAVIDAICWRGTKLSIELEDGIEIIARGKVTTYPQRSKYQIIVDYVVPAGVGDLQKLLKQRYAIYKEKGYFDAERKKPLPKYPFRIGVVTSPTGAVVHDILHRIEDRFPCCTVYIWPVQVQGAGAELQVAHAIVDFNKNTRPDVIIVARGGGSLEDLWAFNEEAVLNAVYESQIPIIAAIGHETDVTLIDYVADRRAPTPTAAAEMAVPVKNDLLLQIDQLYMRLKRAVLSFVKQFDVKLNLLTLKSPSQLIEDKMLRCDDLYERIVQGVRRYLQFKDFQIKRFVFDLKAIDVKQKDLRIIFDKLIRTSTNYISKYENRYKDAAHLFEKFDIQKTLERGFCLPIGQKKILTKKEVSDCSSFELQFYDGILGIEKI